MAALQHNVHISLKDLISRGFDFVWLSRKFKQIEPTIVTSFAYALYSVLVITFFVNVVALYLGGDKMLANISPISL